MTFVPVNFDEAVEPTIAPAGRYNLQIVSCEVVKTGEKSKVPGMDQYKVQVGFPDEPTYKNITKFISLPHEFDEKKSADFKVLLLKRWLVQWKIPFQSNGFEIESLAMDMVGATAQAEVKLTEPNADDQVYNEIVTPAMPAEPTRARR